MPQAEAHSHAMDQSSMISKLVEAGISNVQAKAHADILTESMNAHSEVHADLATKADIESMSENIATALREEIAASNSELREEIAASNSALKKEMHALENKLTSSIDRVVKDIVYIKNDLKESIVSVKENLASIEYNHGKRIGAIENNIATVKYDIATVRHDLVVAKDDIANRIVSMKEVVVNEKIGKIDWNVMFSVAIIALLVAIIGIILYKI